VTLWAAAAAGVFGMVIESGLLTAIYNEHMTPPILAASVLLSGAGRPSPRWRQPC
jgi:hypothetical protein